MAVLDWILDPGLRRPILMTAFEGWFDSGEGATRAIEWLARIHDADEFARIDSETFFDFQQQRPTVAFDDEGRRTITWPDSRCFGTRVESTDHDIALLSGIEPHLRWQTFTDAIVETAERIGAELVVTLGANYGTVPHTRSPEVVGSSTNRDLARRLELDQPSYQGPTGVIGALHDRLDRAGIPVISLRVATPHYVQGGHNPKATQALLRRLELVLGLETQPSGLDDEVREWEARVTEAVGEDMEVEQYVQMLEQQVDDAADSLGTPGDLAAEVEAFLREQGDDT